MLPFNDFGVYLIFLDNVVEQIKLKSEYITTLGLYVTERR